MGNCLWHGGTVLRLDRVGNNTMNEKETPSPNAGILKALGLGFSLWIWGMEDKLSPHQPSLVVQTYNQSLLVQLRQEDNGFKSILENSVTCSPWALIIKSWLFFETG